MSTAILYSGQARTFARCLPTQHWHVYRHFEDLHFFVVWQNDPQAVAGVKLLEEKYGADRVHAKLINDPTDLPLIPLKYAEHAPYLNAAPHPQLLMQHWYQWQVWEFFNANRAGYFLTQGEVADARIIRMRGDNFFHSYSGTDGRGIWEGSVVLSPWWGRFGGLNDRFAVMNFAGAQKYFTVYPRINELLSAGCPFHPESLLKAAVGASSETLLAEFSTQREKGEMRRYESEVQPCDHAHLSVR